MLTRLVDRFIFTLSLLMIAIVTACHIRLGQTSHIFELQFMLVLMANGIISSAAPIVTRIFYLISESKIGRGSQSWSIVTKEKKKLLNTIQSGSQHLPLKKSRCFVRLRPFLPSHRGLLRTLSILLILFAIPLVIYYLVEMRSLTDNAKIMIASSCPQNLMNDDASHAITIGVVFFFYDYVSHHPYVNFLTGHTSATLHQFYNINAIISYSSISYHVSYLSLRVLISSLVVTVKVRCRSWGRF